LELAHRFSGACQALPSIVREEGITQAHPFRWARIDPRTDTSTIDGHAVKLDVPLYVPDGLAHIARALSMLPEGLLRAVRTVTLNRTPEAMNGGDAEQATDSKGDLRISATRSGDASVAGELEAALYHESGHMLSIPWPGNEWMLQREAMRHDGMAASRCAGRQVHEDLAESGAADLLSALAGVQDEYRAVCSHRFASCDELIAEQG
jgi:hypothetical protein